MRVVDQSLLDSLRGRACEWCKKRPGDPHHLLARGHGGGLRMDIMANLAVLCYLCHAFTHSGQEPTRSQLLVLVAEREKMRPSDLLELLWRVQRADKKADLATLLEGTNG